ncbi:MAG: DUF1853 family protein [Cryomorphaceae bacterium]|nr:DUF1853 family protein [Cryomorphaceae bacterium]
MNKNPFYHREIANLAWIIGSSSLMAKSTLLPGLKDSAWFRAQYQLHYSWLKELDSSTPPEELQHTMTREPLGKAFERHVGFWLRESPHFTLHTQNLQVSAAQTVGEFDFIFSDNERTYHLEVACKFYLSKANGTDWRQWVGPNGIDSLAEKMDALQRQLELSQHPAGKAALEKMGIDSVEPIAMIKGYFFHHYSDIHRATPPKGASPDYNSGWWVYEDELSTFISETASYLIIPKSEWLANWHQPDHERILYGARCVEECLKQIETTNSAVGLVQLIQDNGLWVELSRGFVVRRKLFQRSNQSRNS